MRAPFQPLAIALFSLIFVPCLLADEFGTPDWRRYQPTAINTQPLPASILRQRIVDRAYELIGRPYKKGGMSEETGFDCSGLLVYLYKSVAGLKLPRTTKGMLAKHDTTVSRNELQPGDVVFFSRNGTDQVGHVGLYIGNNYFIHAPRAGKHIRISSLVESYWRRSYLTARNFGD